MSEATLNVYVAFKEDIGLGAQHSIMGRDFDDGLGHVTWVLFENVFPPANDEIVEQGNLVIQHHGERAGHGDNPGMGTCLCIPLTSIRYWRVEVIENE